MGKKKIKKRTPKVKDYNVENDLSEKFKGDENFDREFDIEFDEENGSLVFVHYFKHEWGDGMDAVIEHEVPIDAAIKLCGDYLEFAKSFKEKVVPEKKLEVAEEGNPIKTTSEVGSNEE